MEYNLRTPYVTHRPRVVRLSRKEGTSFGFAVRGGKEHGTGIYVSAVEPDSEADRQGLRVGNHFIPFTLISTSGVPIAQKEDSWFLDHLRCS